MNKVSTAQIFIDALNSDYFQSRKNELKRRILDCVYGETPNDPIGYFVSVKRNIDCHLGNGFSDAVCLEQTLQPTLLESVCTEMIFNCIKYHFDCGLPITGRLLNKANCANYGKQVSYTAKWFMRRQPLVMQYNSSLVGEAILNSKYSKEFKKAANGNLTTVASTFMLEKQLNFNANFLMYFMYKFHPKWNNFDSSKIDRVSLRSYLSNCNIEDDIFQNYINSLLSNKVLNSSK